MKERVIGVCRTYSVPNFHLSDAIHVDKQFHPFFWAKQSNESRHLRNAFCYWLLNGSKVGPVPPAFLLVDCTILEEAGGIGHPAATARACCGGDLPLCGVAQFASSWVRSTRNRRTSVPFPLTVNSTFLGPTAAGLKQAKPPCAAPSNPSCDSDGTAVLTIGDFWCAAPSRSHDLFGHLVENYQHYE